MQRKIKEIFLAVHLPFVAHLSDSVGTPLTLTLNTE